MGRAFGAALAFAGPYDLDCLGGVREDDPGCEGDDLVGAGHRAAVAGVGLAVPDRHVFPRQTRQLIAQRLLVALHGDHVVRATAVQVLGVLPLRVQGISGDDETGHIGDRVEKRGEHGDLVALLSDLDLTQRDPAVMIQARHHHPRPLLTVARTPQRLPVNRDRATWRSSSPPARPRARRPRPCGLDTPGQPSTDRGVEPITGERRERPPDRGRVRRADLHPAQRVINRVTDRASGPFSDRGERTRAGDHRAHRHEQDHREPMPHTPFLAWVRHRLQHLQQQTFSLGAGVMPGGRVFGGWVCRDVVVRRGWGLVASRGFRGWLCGGCP